jgi:XRE family transcriptional regulator, fatty acid utilization regulator
MTRMETSRRFVGPRLRRLRMDRGLSQAAFAAALQVSPSYYNQLEHDRRAASDAVLARLAQSFGVDPTWLAPEAEARVVSQLADMLGRGGDLDLGELREVVQRAPSVASAILALASAPEAVVGPHEVVRDFFYRRRNHIAALDLAAEKLAARWRVEPGRQVEGLARALHAEHGVTVVEGTDDGVRRSFDPDRRELRLPRSLPAGRRAFQMGVQLALLGQAQVIEQTLADAPELDPVAREVARIGLAQYYAGALMLPYTVFHAEAERSRYDIDQLAEHFGVGFETICHRLSTLQRRGARGVPFFLVRTDRAGNISKRQSATAFHFSRTGGSCPLWIVHEAFETPDRIRRQVARMPDGRAYLWIARTVTGPATGFRQPQAAFAVGMGCDIRYAHRLVYGDGLDVSPGAPATPIGPGCRSCPREGCVQRAFPMDGHPPATNPNRAGTAPYQ